MIRHSLILLLLLGLAQISYAQVHCGLEARTTDEAGCDLCHLSQLAAFAADAPDHRPSPEIGATAPTIAPTHPFPRSPRRPKGRAPPR